MRLTGSEGEEEALVGVGLEDLDDALAHALVAAVDELLPEVLVDVRGGGGVDGRQGRVAEVGDLRETPRMRSPGG